MLFRANTTRIFEGTRIVKTGMPTALARSSSGSQATVASVVTSTLLAGLGFSGGVISSFPSSVWPSRAPTHNPTSTRQTTEPSKDATASAVTTAAAKDNGEAGGEDRDSCKGQGEDGEREGEDKDEEEEEDEKDEKKEKKGSGRVGKAGLKDRSTAMSEPPSETPDSTAKEAASEIATFPAPNDSAATLRPSTGRDKKHWPFSIHTAVVADRDEREAPLKRSED
ncbi:receptor-type tyrosine-protein phosphatase gamma-like protein [Lates japonicus]|uniref:Receptor-type tyrosine-protein phosphatase gamma-like protein n=1 Tax=Lates japonicus TaxID=270547 RepID=A0AAD3NLK4_LATJO|nr:receptor-type tyrosine-protein phosphatase gamma-like protein [Lates japonicus]